MAVDAGAMEVGDKLLKLWVLLLVPVLFSSKWVDVMREIVDSTPFVATMLELYTLVELMRNNEWCDVFISIPLLVAQVWCFEASWVEYEKPCFIIIVVAAHAFRIIWMSRAKSPLYLLTAYAGYSSLMLSVSGDLCDYAKSKGSWN